MPTLRSPAPATADQQRTAPQSTYAAGPAVTNRVRALNPGNSHTIICTKLSGQDYGIVDAVDEDECWTLSGWKEEPSVPESARKASAKLSKYKPATKPEPLSNTPSSKGLLSNNSSSKSIGGLRRGAGPVPGLRDCSGSAPGPSCKKHSSKVAVQPANATAGGSSQARGQRQQQLLRQQHARLQHARLQQQLGPTGEEETAEDDSAAEHYRPTAAAATAAGDAAGDITGVEQETRFPAIASAEFATSQTAQQERALKGGSRDSSRSGSPLQQQQQQQQQQQEEVPADGDALMQGILNRLATAAGGSTSSSSSRTLRPTMSFGASSCTASTDSSLCPSQQQWQQQQACDGSCTSRSATALRFAQQPAAAAGWSPTPRGTLQLGSTIRRCQSNIGSSCSASGASPRIAAATPQQCDIALHEQQLATAVAEVVDGLEQQVLGATAVVDSNSSKITAGLPMAAMEATGSGPASGSSGQSRCAYVKGPLNSSIANLQQRLLHATPAAGQLCSTGSSGSCMAKSLLPGGFASGTCQLGISGSSYSTVGSSSSGFGSHSSKLLTPGLAARAQMLLTRDLTSVTPRTPRTRMPQAGTQPAATAAAASTGTFGLDVIAGAAGAAHNNTSRSRPTSGNRAAAASLRDQMLEAGNTTWSQMSVPLGYSSGSSKKVQLLSSGSPAGSRPASAGIHGSQASAEQSSTSAGQIAAVRAQQPAVDELLQLISRTSDTACSTTASNTGTGRLAAVGSKLFSISREPSSSSLTHMKAGQLVCYTNSTGRAGPPTAAAAAAAAARRNGLQLVGNQAGVGLSRLSS